MGAGNRPRAGKRDRRWALGLRPAYRLGRCRASPSLVSDLEPTSSNLGTAKLDKSNARRHWRGPIRPTCPRRRSEILSRQFERGTNVLEKIRQGQRSLFSFLYNYGWTGWTGWTGTGNAAASRVQPRRVYLDGPDRRTSPQRLQGSKVSPPCPPPSSVHCQRPAAPRHHRARPPPCRLHSALEAQRAQLVARLPIIF
jgi:hypothetical protein